MTTEAFPHVTPRSAWTDGQRGIVRKLITQLAKAETTLDRVRELAATWDDQATEWYYDNRHDNKNGITYVAGFEDGWTHATDLLRHALEEQQ